jgi:hypothetical protein
MILCLLPLSLQSGLTRVLYSGIIHTQAEVDDILERLDTVGGCVRGMKGEKVAIASDPSGRSA